MIRLRGNTPIRIMIFVMAATEVSPQDSQLFWLTELTQSFKKLFPTVGVRCSLLMCISIKHGQSLADICRLVPIQPFYCIYSLLFTFIYFYLLIVVAHFFAYITPLTNKGPDCDEVIPICTYGAYTPKGPHGRFSIMK